MGVTAGFVLNPAQTPLRLSKVSTQRSGAVAREHVVPALAEYRTRLVEGEVAFLEWAARTDNAGAEDGVDSFVIRDGRIVAQTIHYTVQPRAGPTREDSR